MLLRDAVVIEQAPHEIISPGMLERDGVCDWAGFFPDGARVVLRNHRFITMPRCDPGQTTHTHIGTSGGSELVTDVHSVDDNANFDGSANKTLLYWFSGTSTEPDSLAAQWEQLTGQGAISRDTKRDRLESLLRDEVYNHDLRLIENGTISCGMFSIPCETHSVSLFRPHGNIRALRLDAPGERHVLGRPDLTPSERAKVNASNILTIL